MKQRLLSLGAIALTVIALTLPSSARTPCSGCASASPGVAILHASALPRPDESLGIEDARYFIPEVGSTAIEAGTLLEVGWPGRIQGHFRFRTSDVDPFTGLFEPPEMAVLWSIRNSDGGFVGSAEWAGDGQAMAPVLAEFDPQTGQGVAYFDIPVASTDRDLVFPPLPKGSCRIEFAFGLLGELTHDAIGAPAYARWWGTLSFTTQYPPLLVVVDNPLVGLGEKVLVDLFFNGITDAPRQCTLETRGLARLTLAGSSASQWTLDVPAFTRQYSVELTAMNEGFFRIKARLDDGLGAQSQNCEVLAGLPALAEYATFWTAPVYPGRGTKKEKCFQGRDAGVGGDMDVNCTGAYLEAFGPPPNPDCGSGEKGRVIDTHCIPGGSGCEFDGDTTVDAAKYVYRGTVDRDVGSATLGMKLGVSGEVDLYLMKTGADHEVSGTFESKITRRCCRFVPAGGTVPVKVKKCK